MPFEPRNHIYHRKIIESLSLKITTQESKGYYLKLVFAIFHYF